MKKIVAIAFVSALILSSCAKKEEVTESNTMLPEPESVGATPAPMADSTAVVAPKAAESTMTK
jgi:PBP1b-binding outer membrane lipoprotein LpoB